MSDDLSRCRMYDSEPIWELLRCGGRNSGAVHLFLAYLNIAQYGEAYPSTYTLSKLTNMDRHTIMKWQEWLLENGWLEKTGETAADKYENPPRGANKVPVLRLSDKALGCMKLSDTAAETGKMSETSKVEGRGGNFHLPSGNFPLPKLSPKGFIGY